MKGLAVAFAVSTVLMTSGAPAFTQTSEGTPISAYEGPALSDAQMHDAVAYVERHVKLPKSSRALGAYGRYYAQDRGIVYAVYAVPYEGSNRQSGVHIVAYDALPGIMDGGCDVIDVTFIPKTKALGADCHGEA